MRGHTGWANGRGERGVPLEAARELVREADEARALATRSARQAELARREAAELRQALDEVVRRLEAERTARALPEDPLPEAAADGRVQALLSDLANVRRQRDVEIARVRAAERGDGLTRLLDVVDDLARAVDAHPDPASPWAQGTVAVLARVRHQLASGGGERFGEVGDRFDPTLHEAVGTADGPAGTVVAVHRSGLRLTDGTLVRPATVLVATGARPFDPSAPEAPR